MTQTILRPSTEQERRAYLQALLSSGKVPEDRPAFGDLEEVIDNIVVVAFHSKGDVLAIKRCIDNLSAKYPELRALLQPEEKKPHIEVSDLPDIPPLPEGVTLPQELSRGGCRWLDEYEQFSSTWSPRSYEHFHVACGAWLLSSVALRRVYIPFGPGEYTPLFISLVAPTSLHAKTTAASIAERTLRAAGLGWVLAPDTITPQKLHSNMSGKLPKDYDKMSIEDQAKAELRYAFSGQMAWFYDEFGQQMDGMAAKNGIMADFKGILRRLDDCKPQASYDTHTRGLEFIDNPYMSLLASMTPSDARPYAGKGASFWKDGFFARFAFVTPPVDEEPRKDRFPVGEMCIPISLTAPLIAWHDRLDKPHLDIQAEKDNKGDVIKYTITRGDLPRQKCQFGHGVEDLYYRYSDALGSLVYEYRLEDLAGNYARLPAKALRLAALFASLENRGIIEIRHWAKAQGIAETWRTCLHHFEMSLLQNSAAQAQAELEARIIEKVSKKPIAVSVLRDGDRQFKRHDPRKFREIIDDMIKAGELERDSKNKRQVRIPEKR